MRANVVGALTLLDVCEARGLSHIVFSTGCVYTYNKPGEGPHALGSGIGFTESDAPNFSGSYYSFTKCVRAIRVCNFPTDGTGQGARVGVCGCERYAVAQRGRVQGLLEQLIERTNYSCLLLLRVRLPLGDDFSSRSLISKLLQYDKLVDIPNSITVLSDMLPIAIQMAQDDRRGIYNFTQSGTISHSELMTLYRDIVDPSVRWSHFSEAEQAAVIKVPRSNCELDVSKLKSQYPQLKTAHEAVRAAFTHMRALVDAGAPLPTRAAK